MSHTLSIFSYGRIERYRIDFRPLEKRKQNQYFAWNFIMLSKCINKYIKILDNLVVRSRTNGCMAKTISGQKLSAPAFEVCISFYCPCVCSSQVRVSRDHVQSQRDRNRTRGRKSILEARHHYQSNYSTRKWEITPSIEP